MFLDKCRLGPVPATSRSGVSQAQENENNKGKQGKDGGLSRGERGGREPLPGSRGPSLWRLADESWFFLLGRDYAPASPSTRPSNCSSGTISS